MTWLRLVGQGAVWGLVALAGAVLLAAVLVPRLAGATPYTVLTGSMQPSYPPGTLVVVRPLDPDDSGDGGEDVAVGDVVTYQRESGVATVVTHRVVGVATDTVSGERTLTTKGDANTVADLEPVQMAQVRGTLWYAVPYLGQLSALFSGEQRLWATYGLGAALLSYAAAMAIGGLRDRRRQPAGQTAPEPVRETTPDPVR